MSDLIEVGYVARAHGLRGEVRVELHNPGAETLFDAEAVYVGGLRFAVAGARPGPGDGVLLTLEGVTDRDAADALRGRAVEVRRDQIHLGDGEVLVADLVGCAAVLEDGTPWGVIVAVEVGAQDRLVIRDGDVVRQLPLVDAFVRGVDLVARSVVVAPPAGLPEERAK